MNHTPKNAGEDKIIKIHKYKTSDDNKENYLQYNVENVERRNRSKRLNFGQMFIRHSLPALKLHPQYFKTKFTKSEIRALHRPTIQVPVGEIRSDNGEKRWTKEYITDPSVINAYIRQRQVIEEQTLNTETLEPTNDEERNERLKKRIQDQLARLKRNQERRQQRLAVREAKKAAKLSAAGNVTSASSIVKEKKTETTRRCGNCGALGHMKTNKKCPLYNTKKAAKLSAAGNVTSASSIVKEKKTETTRRCGNCGALGHMKTNKKCPLYNSNNIPSESSTTTKRILTTTAGFEPALPMGIRFQV
ncbi:2692_t:CDS:10 [Entrophospora sp. SA101]|nr:2692_t:CDS:10 [Entrophospora sp. SA101]